MDIRYGNTTLTVCALFKVGDMPPAGYLDREEWWHVQKKGGLKQVKCGCGKWRYPQELSGIVQTYTAINRKGEKVEMSTPICLECHQRTTGKQ